MYAPGTESLIKQAREIQEEELQKFYGRVLKQLQSSKDAGGELVDSLQRLHLIVSATKYARTLPPELSKKLQALLRSPSSPEQFHALSSAILRESLPLSAQSLSIEFNQDSRALSYLASVVLSQAGRKEDLLPLCQHLLRSLESRQPEIQPPKHTLPILSKMFTFSSLLLSEDQVNLVSRKLADWLRYASVHQGASISSGGFFTSPRTRQVEHKPTQCIHSHTTSCQTRGSWLNPTFICQAWQSYLDIFSEDIGYNCSSFQLTFYPAWFVFPQPALMTEVDGAVAGDFFTVLCVGQNYTDDQWMNMYTFSMVKSWLLTYNTEGSSNVDSDDRSEMDSSVMSMVSATSSSSRLLPPKERLREKAFEYCHRLIEQSDRKALKRADAELQKACMVEAVSVMDIICSEDASYVYRAFPCIKALHGRLSTDLAFARALLPVAQFYLNHSETAAVDSEAIFCQLFSRFPAELFNEPMLAFEFVHFCLHNVSVLQEKVAVYRRSFPNLLKFLAWNGPGLISEFMELLPSLLAPDTALELLHTLLDLPCLAATLDLQHRCFASGDMWHVILESKWFIFFTFCVLLFRLSMLHEALEGMVESPRVVHCAQIVPVLLHVYFNTVTQKQAMFIVHLTYMLYKFYLRWSSCICAQVWVIGEYLSLSYNPCCTVELITSFFEGLEAVLFEITQVRQSASPPRYTPRLLTVLMTALAKLASRSQDLIPRASLFLSKIHSFAHSGPVEICFSEDDTEEIITCAQELNNLLKLPNVAQFVLTPAAQADGPRWHRDTNTALPHRMRAISSLLQNHSSFLPA
uniref:Adaptor related protein complex 5 subunit zeta 1 n=1 Tax=Electrophorus electricus TaxID=8005 RepID=A0AAY5EES9_ELEEL